MADAAFGVEVMKSSASLTIHFRGDGVSAASLQHYRLFRPTPLVDRRITDEATKASPTQAGSRASSTSIHDGHQQLSLLANMQYWQCPARCAMRCSRRQRLVAQTRPALRFLNHQCKPLIIAARRFSGRAIMQATRRVTLPPMAIQDTRLRR